MITDEQFRKTEGRLFRYFKSLRDTDKLKHNISILNKQIDSITEDIRTNNVILEEESRSTSFEERVQSSSDGCSHAEREFLRQMENLELELIFLKKKKAKTECRIREIEREIADMEHTVGLLEPQYKTFVELKYKKELSFQRIGEELHIEKSTASDWRKRIIIDVAKVIGTKK